MQNFDFQQLRLFRGAVPNLDRLFRKSSWTRHETTHSLNVKFYEPTSKGIAKLIGMWYHEV
jgi:hypothetical protein